LIAILRTLSTSGYLYMDPLKLYSIPTPYLHPSFALLNSILSSLV
jgi:hypothetical protein